MGNRHATQTDSVLLRRCRKGITFEVAVAKMAGKPVLVFDPTPTAAPTIADSDLTTLSSFP